MSGRKITLLDGGTGTELRLRGVEVPSHVSSIWSAKALIDAPGAVVEVHRAYIDAGADVITANNYAVTPPLLAREGIEERVEELTALAADLARRARERSSRTGRTGRTSRTVRIAGSLPPLETSYRADLVGGDAVIVAAYRRIAAALAPRVDVLLCETMASAREAVAAVTAARETGLEVWVSWTLQGDWPDHLPSGETVTEALEALAGAGLAADAYMVNCCGANLVTAAMPALARLTDRPFGGYANSADVVVPDGDARRERPAGESAERTALDVEQYAAAVSRWIAAGASIVGGCCSTRPQHIKRLRDLIDMQ